MWQLSSTTVHLHILCWEGFFNCWLFIHGYHWTQASSVQLRSRKHDLLVFSLECCANECTLASFFRSDMCTVYWILGHHWLLWTDPLLSLHSNINCQHDLFKQLSAYLESVLTLSVMSRWVALLWLLCYMVVVSNTMIRCLRQYQSILTVCGCFISVIAGAVWAAWLLLQTVPTAEQQELHHSFAQRTSPSLSVMPNILQHHVLRWASKSTHFLLHLLTLMSTMFDTVPLVPLPNQSQNCSWAVYKKEVVKLVSQMCAWPLVQPKNVCQCNM